MIKKISLALLFAFLLAPVGQVFAAPYEGYSLADGIVTDVRSFNSMSPNPCHISYEVVLGDITRIGENLSYDFCHLEIGDTVKIKYLDSDFRKHEVASETQIKSIQENKTSVIDTRTNGWGVVEIIFGILFVIPFILGPIVPLAIIFLIVRALRRSHGDDKKPATAEQKKLIQEGFRKLGVYHDVKKKITRAQARETLAEIDHQLHHNKK